jgi:FkbM family methyltransferase
MKHGYRLNLFPARDRYEARLYRLATYEPPTLALLDAAIRPEDTVVDVGANIGTISLHMARKAVRVIAIEPHPAYCTRIREHIALNGVANIELIESAAGIAPGTAMIYDMPAKNIGHSTMVEQGSHTAAAAGVRVNTLDALLDGAGGQNVRLIKVDVEGFENQVMAGAPRTLATGPIVCMEFAPQHQGSDPFAAHERIMAAAPFRCYRFQSTVLRSWHLAPIAGTSELSCLRFGNVAYVMDAVRATMPRHIFA